MISLRTGNLGVSQLQAAFAGDELPDGAKARADLRLWRDQGFDQVEDYVAWCVAEPSEGAFDWSLYRENARSARAAGLQYYAYVWVHASPTWFREDDAFVPSRCTEHRCESVFPSVFAPSTIQVTERFLRNVRAGLGDVLDGIVLGFPADYGELGFASGVADWLFVKQEQGDRPHHLGYWCGEQVAQDEFERRMLERYGSLPALADAWGLPLELATGCPYPDDRASPAHWRDFAQFYTGAVTRWTDDSLRLTQELFPDIPREVKLGHCSETLHLGRDLPALVSVAARHGATVRSTQSGMGEFFSARLASLCRTYGTPFATESPREIARDRLVERVFVDAAQGASSYFEYPEQLEQTGALVEHVTSRAGTGPLPRKVACFYPSDDFAVRPGLGVPEEVALTYGELRRSVDLTLLDEHQLAAGALDDTACLLWMQTASVAPGVLPRLEAWVRAGGVLIYTAPTPPFVRGGDERDHHACGRLVGQLLEATSDVRYRMEAPESVSVAPGEESARAFLGPGWLERENGAFAWTEAGETVPSRWLGGEGHVVLPRPPGERLRLVIDLFVPEPVAARGGSVTISAWDGERFESLGLVRASGPSHVELELRPPLHDAVVRLAISSATFRPGDTNGDGSVPHGGDRRELGTLVRELCLQPWDGDHGAGREPVAVRGALVSGARVEHARGTDGSLETSIPWASVAPPPPGLATVLAGVYVDLRPGPAAQALDRGRILCGDGTPLSALAWLHSWLDHRIPGAASPTIPRDDRRACLVTAFPAGALVHNPDPREAHELRLVGTGRRVYRAELAPLETRWLPNE